MSRKGGANSAKTVQAATPGLARNIGWYFFLGMVALTPIVIGMLPPQIGPLSAYSAFDPIGLPKVVTFMVLAGLSLAFLRVSTSRGESEIYWHPVMWIAGALVVWAAISTLLSTSPIVSVLGHVRNWHGLAADFGYFLVAFLAIQYVRSTRQLRAVMIAAAFSGSVVAIYAVFQFLGMDAIAWVGETGRVFSSHGNADMLGNYLLFPLALVLGLALTETSSRLRYLWWGVAAFVAVALVLTTTIGAWIGAAVMLVCVGFAIWHGVWHPTRRQQLIVVGMGLLAVVGAVGAAAVLRPDSLSRLAGAPLLTRLSNGRTVIWETGIRAGLSRPITGWGPDGFEHAFQSAVGPEWFAIVPGIQVVVDAHNFLIQTFVTLGLPGLVLTLWVLGRTALESLRTLRAAEGARRILLAAPWAALIGLFTAFFFGVSGTIVGVWLWLAVGLLLAPMARPVSALPRPVLYASSVLGVVLALWAGSWLVADVVVGHASQLQPGAAQVAETRLAVRLNPLQPTYHWQYADALLNKALADKRAGVGAAEYELEVLDVLAAYDRMARVDEGNTHIRALQATLLDSYAQQHPESDAAQRAVQAGQEAVSLAPRNPAALAALAKAYQLVGRIGEAEQTARLAREIAPAYSMQTLGSLGLEATTTP